MHFNKNTFLYKIIILMLILTASFSSKTVSAKDALKLSYYVTYGQTEARGMLTELNKWRTSDTWQWAPDNKTKEVIKGRQPLVYDYEL